QHLAASDDLALVRGGGAELAADRAAVEVGIRLLGADTLNASLDANLALELHPEEDERGPRVLVQLGALAALVIAKEHEATLVHLLEQHHTRRGQALGARCGQRHRIRLWQPGLERGVEPALKLAERILVQLAHLKAALHVLPAQ